MISQRQLGGGQRQAPERTGINRQCSLLPHSGVPGPDPIEAPSPTSVELVDKLGNGLVDAGVAVRTARTSDETFAPVAFKDHLAALPLGGA
jgi:hypothetical protein